MGSCISKLYHWVIEQRRDQEDVDKKALPAKKSIRNVERQMRKLTNNFYSITRKGEKWTPEQTALIRKYINYRTFKPIPKSFVDTIYGGYDKETGECTYLPPKFIMFNFDWSNGKRQSLRGLTCISVSGTDTIKSCRGLPPLDLTYYSLDLIGNDSIGKGPAAAAKKRNKTITKSGADMLKYWIKFGKKSPFNYFKLNAMENVIGFYWKFGFKFNYRRENTSRHNEELWNARIQQLNIYNRRAKLSIYEDWERSKYLEKYFDRFMNGYYKDSYIGSHLAREEIDSIFTSTLKQHQYDLRYHGYPMYYHFK